MCEAGAERNGDSGRRRISALAHAVRGNLGFDFVWLLALSLLAQGFLLGLAQAQIVEDPPSPPNTPEAPVAERPGVEVSASLTTNRDSLMAEIRVYSEMIRGLRDSLASDGPNLRLSGAQREKLEGSIQDITQVIERISSELSRMEFEIKDNRISLVNESGEGIIINVPEDLDEQVSQGIEALTKIILSELPDSVDFDQGRNWDWTRFRPEPPPPSRRVINGNIVKVWDDVDISATEDVRGNVVVIFGDAEVAGRVDGDVVAVLGNVTLLDSAEVTGSVVTVGGFLEQEQGAQVDDVVVLDPLRVDNGGGWLDIFSHDGLSFLICQGVFLLTVLMAAIAVAVTPRRRFESIIGHLKQNVGASLGLGVVTALGGHLLVAVLMAVLVLTVIGVPLALLVGLGLLVAVVVSVAVCSAVVGERLCALFSDQCHSPWLVMVVGMAALHTVSFLGSLLGMVSGADSAAAALVALGVMIKAGAYLLGLGALVLSRAGSRLPAS